MIHWLSFAGHGAMVVDADNFPHACRIAREHGAPMDTEIIGGNVEPPAGEPDGPADVWSRDPANQNRMLSGEEIERVFGPLESDEKIRALADGPNATHLDSIEEH